MTIQEIQERFMQRKEEADNLYAQMGEMRRKSPEVAKYADLCREWSNAERAVGTLRDLLWQME